MARRTHRSPPTPRLLVVLGATGTGKSALAFELARHLDGEIVGCDALQVYRELEVGTAKPGRTLRARVAHHLIDCADPRRDFSVADYLARAEAAIDAIAGRGRVPLVVGGTGMYLRALLRGLGDGPPRDAALRARLRRVAERRGPAFLHECLGRRNPERARAVAPHDLQRIIRGLELTRHARGDRPSPPPADLWKSGVERYDALKVGLRMDRGRHVSLLERRVQSFYAAGLVAEVRRLLDEGVPPGANALKALGYREVLAALLEGRDALSTLELAQRNTRRYAKRQRSWFATEPGVHWFEIHDPADACGESIVRRVLALWAGASCGGTRGGA